MTRRHRSHFRHALDATLRAVDTGRHVHRASGIGDDVHNYAGSLGGGSVYRVRERPAWFVSEYAFWTVGGLDLKAVGWVLMAAGVVGLVRSGERTWQGASGLGDLRGKRPARAGDRFRVGSVTKSFVATLVLQLVGEGGLSLDGNLERWLPGLVPNGETITVRQLLNHTSGLYNYTDDLPEPPRSFRPKELVAIATGHKPLFAPGARFSYSNTNYILAGMLIERVTGQRLADQLRQRIFQPLGLGDTELPATQERIAGPHVRGYAPPDEDWQVSDGSARLVDVTEMDTSWGWAAGAMVSTTADLARFYQALLGGRLLRPELLEQMRTTVDASQVGHGTRYGLGLEVLRPGCGVELWGHGGSLPGYGTTAFSTPDADRQLVMATNLQPEPEPGAAAAAVENILRREVSC